MLIELLSQYCIPVCFLAAVVIFVLIVARIGSAAQRRRLTAIAAAFQGEIKSGLLGICFLGYHNSRRFKVMTSEAGNNIPPKLHIALLVPCSFKLQVTREGKDTLFLKNIGLLKDVQTGDPAFDAQFVLSSDAAEAVQSLFVSPENKEAARRLADLGFYLTFDKTGVTAIKPSYNADGDMTAAAVEVVLVQLDILSQRLAG